VKYGSAVGPYAPNADLDFIQQQQQKRVLTISASKHGFANFPENVTNGGRFVKFKMPRPLKGPHSLQAEMAH
jgi:hypothetical protein